MNDFRLLFASIALATAAAEDFDVKSNYTKTEYRIAMRDGVKLYTAVYTPKDSTGDLPILLTRTPYGAGPYGPNSYPKRLGPLGFAEEKFIFAVQDVRGRFMSEGEFEDVRPIKDKLSGPKDTDETTDTYDTIDWLMKSVAGNNGKAGMIGTSYNGFYTSSALVRSHPALRAASPQAPMADLYRGDDAYHNGAFFLVANFSFYTSFYPQNNPGPPTPTAEFNYGAQDGYQFYLHMGPLSNSDQLLHDKNPYWTDMYRHTLEDDFWKSRDILPHLKSVAPAVLIVGGWYDAEDLSGTLKTFRAIRAQSPQTVCKLVMGPWSHGAWNYTNGDKLGDISFEANTAETFRAAELNFFKQYLKDAALAPLPEALMFETGGNQWKNLAQWPPAAAARKLYFHAHGKLSFESPADLTGFDEYVSDPDNPVPFAAIKSFAMEKTYMDADQRFVAGRKDVLTYLSDPLSEDLTIAGPVSPSLFVSTSSTDSDFDVKLIDVFPSDAPGPLAGYAQLVRGEPFRGKFRHSFEKPEPFKPNVVEQIRFDMPDIYHCFRKGHQVMVQVQSSWFPLTDRNPQTFTDIPAAKPGEFVKATERLYRSRPFASYLEFNVEAH